MMRMEDVIIGGWGVSYLLSNDIKSLSTKGLYNRGYLAAASFFSRLPRNKTLPRFKNNKNNKI